MSVESDVVQEAGASQLSAMFDGELSAAECELLSRRLGRDEQLRSRWARYALIGAALRSEPVSAVTRDFSRRVGAAIDAGEAAQAAELARAAQRTARAADESRWLRSLVAGGALAAGVAAAAILVLRGQLANGYEELSAFTPASQRVVSPLRRQRAGGSGMLADAVPAETLAIAGIGNERLASAPRDYVVPPVSDNAPAAPMSLASYVVAHSEYSSPLVRGGLISRLMLDQGVTADAAAGNDAGEVEVVIAADGYR